MLSLEVRFGLSVAFRSFRRHVTPYGIVGRYGVARPGVLFKAVIAAGSHLFPSRTEKLSPLAPMVLHTRGRVGSRHFSERAPTSERMSGLLRIRLRYRYRFRLRACFRYRFRYRYRFRFRACLPRGSGLGRIEERVCGSGISECRYSDIPSFREVYISSSRDAVNS